MKKEKFNLGHTVLYSKGWYKRSENIWDDLVKTLEADDYIGCFNGDSPAQIKGRVTHLIVNQFDRLEKSGYSGTLPDLVEGIKPCNCWKYGYYTREYTFLSSQKEIDLRPNWNYEEAIVRYCLSYFSNLKKDEWNRTIPNKKVLPFKEGISVKEIIDMFNRKVN